MSKNRFEKRFENLNLPRNELDRMYKLEQEYQFQLNWMFEQANLNQRGAGSAAGAGSEITPTLTLSPTPTPTTTPTPTPSPSVTTTTSTTTQVVPITTLPPNQTSSDTYSGGNKQFASTFGSKPMGLKIPIQP